MTVKPRTNLLLDTVIFGLFVVVMISGLLVWVVYPTGGHQGGGRHGDGPILARASTVLGVEKHTMADLHRWVGVAMAAAVTLHLLVHWKWIICQVRRLLARGGPRRQSCRSVPSLPPSLGSQR